MTKTESHGLLHVGILALLLAIFLLPTLGWRDFCDGMENFNVLTAIECARDGHWLIPTSNGLPRLVKPPLTSWVTGLGIMAGGQMEFAARWPSLVIAWVMLVAVYGTGRLLRDARLGLDAAIICATTLFFLRYSGRASYDMQMAAWVTVWSFFVVLVMARGMWRLGCAGAGVALGLALMTKGPPALVWTLLPLAAWGVGEWFGSRGSLKTCLQGRYVSAVALGVGLMLLVALPWVIYVYIKAGNQLGSWYNEVRLGDENLERSREKFGEGLVCLVQLLPWTPLMIAGMCGMKRGMGQVSGQRLRLFVWTVLLPLVIVSCVPPVRDRYLLPMAAPAAILAAVGLSAMREFKWLEVAQWLVVAGLAIGAPAAGTMGIEGMRTVFDRPMFGAVEGALFCGAIVVLLVVSFVVSRKAGAAVLLCWGVVVMAAHMEMMWGSRLTADGYSMAKRAAEQMESRWPGAEYYAFFTSQPPRELSIYLHRPLKLVRTPQEIGVAPPIRLVIRKGGGKRGELMSLQTRGDEWSVYDAASMDAADTQSQPGPGGQGN